MKKGTWKKERAKGRKYCKSDAHKTPKAHSRKKIWVGAYATRHKLGKVRGHWRINPWYKKKRKT